MFRRIFALLLVFSVVTLGMPSFALAGTMSDHSVAQAMHDCVCPPGHEMPSSDDSDPCMPTLGCMIHCGLAPMGMTVDLASPAEPGPTAAAPDIEIPGPVLSSSYPPFRPPSR